MRPCVRPILDQNGGLPAESIIRSSACSRHRRTRRARGVRSQSTAQGRGPLRRPSPASPENGPLRGTGRCAPPWRPRPAPSGGRKVGGHPARSRTHALAGLALCLDEGRGTSCSPIRATGRGLGGWVPRLPTSRVLQGTGESRAGPRPLRDLKGNRCRLRVAVYGTGAPDGARADGSARGSVRRVRVPEPLMPFRRASEAAGARRHLS